ncbi:alpha/beta hydrolase [Jatrophihabitans fulvus]
MTAIALPRFEPDADYVPLPGSRAGELRAYGRMLRMVGPAVPQPARGVGSPALLVPGFLSGDVSLTLLFRELRRRGHRTFRSDIGANVGCTETMVQRLVARLETVAADEGPVTLVGHSRGGMVTALAARRRPELVAGVIALSAPITGTLSVASHVRKQLELLFRLHRRGLTRVLARDCVVGDCAARVAAELAAPFPAQVPLLSVYSRHDAILDWRTCLDPAAEQVEIDAGHVGMATDPRVMRLVADRLALRAGQPTPARA